MCCLAQFSTLRAQNEVMEPLIERSMYGGARDVTTLAASI